jgi:hypothetical protein
LGKLIFSVPYVGSVISFLREPFRLAATIALLFFISAILPAEKSRNKKRRKIRSTSHSYRWVSKRNVLIALLIIPLALSAYSVFYAQSLPTQITKFVEKYRYTHVGSFNYTVELKPNILYNTTTIGPNETIYLSLAKTMNISFSYMFNCTIPADVSGNYSVYMDLELPGEWVKRFTLVGVSPFNSNRFSFNYQLNITAVSELISKIERETASRASTYNLKITPMIHIHASIGEDTVEDYFSPSMTIAFTGNKLNVEGLNQSQPKIVSQTVVEDLKWNMYLRGFSYAALAASSAAMAWAVYYRQTKLEPEAERIKRRYRELIVDLKTPPSQAETPTSVHMASIEDLVKKAQGTGKLIMHEAHPPKHIYYILDGSVKYEYATEEKT